MFRKVEIAIGIFWACGVVCASAAPPTTVTGILVDRVRYTKENKNTANCGQDAAAAKNGGPVAIVTAAGEMYTVLGDLTENNNAKLVPFMCKTVALFGETAGDTKNVRRTILATDLKAVSK